MRTSMTLLLTLALATGALAATLSFDQFAGRVGRNAVQVGDAPKDLCVCTDVGTMQNKAGYLVRASVVWNGGLYVPDEWPAQPEVGFDSSYVDTAVAVMGPYVSPSIEEAITA